MKKAEFAARVAKRSGITKKQAESLIDSVFDCLSEVLAEQDKLSVAGFGVFETKVRAARNGLVPSTGARIQIPETIVPTFRASEKLKEKVNRHEIG